MISEKRTSFYTLHQNQDGQWIIEVLCGDIGIYLRRLNLNSDEIKMIEEWGDYYLEKMALEIARKPELYQERLKEQ